MLAFIALFAVLAIVYCMTNNSEGFETKSGAKNGTSSIIPVTPDRSINIDKVTPYSMPNELPVAGYQQVAAMSPIPYKDTALVKANRQQIESLLETVKSFLAFEAQEISEKSDPAIQLPLQTARSDYQTLQSQSEVLNRNPGIPSTITLTNLNEISSNLAYLQDKVRLTGAASTLQIPRYEFSGSEGFTGSDKRFNKIPTRGSDKGADKGSITGFNKRPATIAELNDFTAKIQGEILRLSASGTNDPVIKSRVAGLTQMKSDVQTIVDQLTKGTLLPSEVPISKKDIDKALPVLGKPSEPLPQLIKTLGLPKGLANALPSTLQKDPQTMQQIRTLIDKYGEQLVNGVSASFSISYTSPNDAKSNGACDAATRSKSTIDKSGFPSMADLNNVSNAKFMPTGSKTRLVSNEVDAEDIVTDPLAQRPMDAGRGPAHFDWMQRAKQIEDQVQKRRLRPSDYGINPAIKASDRSKDFSWKGYARMICTRLQADIDSGLPETCGCPPMDWPGWRR